MTTNALYFALQYQRDIKRITQPRLAAALGIQTRQYQRLEYGEKPMTPAQADKAAETLGCDAIRDIYCHDWCEIGRRNCLPVLNLINANPVAVMLKLQQEIREVTGCLDQAMMLLLNKKSRDDFTRDELEELRRFALKTTALSHCLMHARLVFGEFVDMQSVISEHRAKSQRYIDKTQPPLLLARDEDPAPYFYTIHGGRGGNASKNIFTELTVAAQKTTETENRQATNQPDGVQRKKKPART